MALTRRSVQRMSGSIWPGFVDAMTALLLVLMFVLTIFMVVQGMLRETITGQESELDQLADEITVLSQALGVSQQETADLEDDLTTLQGESTRQATLIASLTGTLADRDAAIATFEDRVASLLGERDAALAEGVTLAAEIDDLEAARAQLITQQEADQLALAQARTEIDSQTEAARLAAAQREALEALTAQLQDEAQARDASLADTLAALTQAQTDGATQAALLAELESQRDRTVAELDASETARLAEAAAAAALQERLATAETQLTAEEQTRLAEAAAAETLRERLRNSDTELTAMTLALEEQRKAAEDTLTLLAAANAAEADLDTRLADALSRLNTAEIALANETATDAELRAELAAALAAQLAAENANVTQLSESERQATLLAAARKELEDETAVSSQAQREAALLNEQVTSLRNDLDTLQGLLDSAAAADTAARVRIETLGSDLNQALARAAAEERRAATEASRRAELEAAEAERLRLEAQRLNNEVTDLAEYRSEFFGTLRQVLGDREGVQVVGDRFVFSSEVLFESASATLSPAGQAQIAQVAGILSDVSGQIPNAIDWIIRVDGHTDNVPLSGTGEFVDNWELSQGRALSVVKFMTDALGFPPERLAATGFGEFRPVNTDNTPAAFAQNRRIELKLTER